MLHLGLTVSLRSFDFSKEFSVFTLFEVLSRNGFIMARQPIDEGLLLYLIRTKFPVSGINEMVQNEISFPILGGIDVNENGFDQSSDFPDVVPELNERNFGNGCCSGRESGGLSPPAFRLKSYCFSISAMTSR